MEHGDEVDLNTAAVTRWLRARFETVQGPRAVPGRLVWNVEPGGGGESFQVRICFDVLAGRLASAREFLSHVAYDARLRAPCPPGFYDVSTGGVCVLGMSDFTFESYGQIVRCYHDAPPVHMGREPAEPGETIWRVEHEGVDRAFLARAKTLDTRESVTQQAVAALMREGVLRIPDAPWSWSVLDEQGREWWARLEAPNLAVRALVLRHCKSIDEQRIPWPEDRQAPRAEELQRLVVGLPL